MLCKLFFFSEITNSNLAPISVLIAEADGLLLLGLGAGEGLPLGVLIFARGGLRVSLGGLEVGLPVWHAGGLPVARRGFSLSFWEPPVGGIFRIVSLNC
jgi:hypothetical protein